MSRQSLRVTQAARGRAVDQRRHDHMWKIVASVIIGLFMWGFLFVVHEEWEQYYTCCGYPRPPFNPGNPLYPVAFMTGVWLSLSAITRWVGRLDVQPASHDA